MNAQAKPIANKTHLSPRARSKRVIKESMCWLAGSHGWLRRQPLAFSRNIFCFWIVRTDARPTTGARLLFSNVESHPRPCGTHNLVFLLFVPLFYGGHAPPPSFRTRSCPCKQALNRVIPRARQTIVSLCCPPMAGLLMVQCIISSIQLYSIATEKRKIQYVYAPSKSTSTGTGR
jgi:hypothetical protein